MYTMYTLRNVVKWTSWANKYVKTFAATRATFSLIHFYSILCRASEDFGFSVSQLSLASMYIRAVLVRFRIVRSPRLCDRDPTIQQFVHLPAINHVDRRLQNGRTCGGFALLESCTQTDGTSCNRRGRGGGHLLPYVGCRGQRMECLESAAGLASC